MQNFTYGVMVAGRANVAVRGLAIRAEGLVVTAPPPETAIPMAQSRNVLGGQQYPQRKSHHEFGHGIQMAATPAYNFVKDNTVAVRNMAMEDLGNFSRVADNMDVRLQSSTRS